MAAKSEECRGRSIFLFENMQKPTMTPNSSSSSKVFSEVLYLLKSKKPSLLLTKVYDLIRWSLRGAKNSGKE